MTLEQIMIVDAIDCGKETLRLYKTRMKVRPRLQEPPFVSDERLSDCLVALGVSLLELPCCLDSLGRLCSSLTFPPKII